jgi:apolipoprotein D and lipocalin family protein
MGSPEHNRPNTMRPVHGLLLVLLLLAGGCTAPPAGVQPVTGFDPQRYLGTWYEIARLDHRFERGLTRVSANYRRRTDGGLDVVNRGYDPDTGAWKEATGKAYFTGTQDTGSLRVSFFGPFYGGYHVIGLDRQDYAWAMVCGPDRDYLWILARTPNPDEAIIDRLLQQAASLGFATDELVFVDHGSD